MLAIIDYYKLDAALGKLYCDSISALNQSSQLRTRIKTGAKQGGLLRVLRSLKINLSFQLTYEHVDAHQDRILAWRYLKLEEQLNGDCDSLAKSAVLRSMIGSNLPSRGK